MRNIAMYIWQLPQNLLGLIVWGILRLAGKVDIVTTYTHYPYKVIRVPYPGFGVSLGKYIILGIVNYPDIEIAHEKGHSKQSEMYGPLYLFIVGIPSLILQFRHRVLHKSWDYKERMEWYYSRWPEKQADQLGKVQRVY